MISGELLLWRNPKGTVEEIQMQLPGLPERIKSVINGEAKECQPITQH